MGVFGGKMGVQQIATAAPLRGIPKGAAARLWHTTLLARYSVLYLCGEDRRRMPTGRAADKLPAARMQIVFQQRRAHARTIPAAGVYRLRSVSFTPCENLCYNNHNYT